MYTSEELKVDYNNMREKKLLRTSESVFLLWLLHTRKLHGYGIKQLLEDECGVSISLSRIYPMLHNLKKKKLVDIVSEERGGRKVKVYSTNKDGLKALKSLKKIIPPLKRKYIEFMLE